MDEMMRYIFNSINVLFTVVISICVAVQHADYYRINKEIRDLKKEIEKLKKTEGDQ